jgi:hypothetical protein
MGKQEDSALQANSKLYKHHSTDLFATGAQKARIHGISREPNRWKFLVVLYPSLDPPEFPLAKHVHLPQKEHRRLRRMCP